jgi:hypothetical protein
MHGLALGGLRLSIVLPNDDRRTAFGLALEQPLIALEDRACDPRREAGLAE